jgi:hypothetical protein
MVYATLSTYLLFSTFCCQNRLETLRTSDVGTINRR